MGPMMGSLNTSWATSFSLAIAGLMADPVELAMSSQKPMIHSHDTN